MKFTFTDDKARLLRVCGVPSGLIQDFVVKYQDYIRSYTEDNKEDGKITCEFSVADQTATIQYLAKLPTSKPCRIVLNTVEETRLLRQFMVPWFYNACIHSKDNPKQTFGNLPYWHYIDFSFNDSLLDILKGKNSQISFEDYKPLLVLDGCFTDSSSNKTEKLRDILNLTLDHVVVLLLGGKDSFAFCKDKLGFKPKQFAVFSSARKRDVL